jgi:hypothetical protein
VGRVGAGAAELEAPAIALERTVNRRQSGNDAIVAEKSPISPGTLMWLNTPVLAVFAFPQQYRFFRNLRFP